MKWIWHAIFEINYLSMISLHLYACAKRRIKHFDCICLCLYGSMQIFAIMCWDAYRVYALFCSVQILPKPKHKPNSFQQIFQEQAFNFGIEKINSPTANRFLLLLLLLSSYMMQGKNAYSLNIMMIWDCKFAKLQRRLDFCLVLFLLSRIVLSMT